MLVSFLRVAVPDEYGALMADTSEEHATPLAFLQALLGRTWRRRRCLQADLRVLLAEQDESFLEAIDDRLKVRNLLARYSSVEAQEEHGPGLQGHF